MEKDPSRPAAQTVCGSLIQDPDKYPSSLYRGDKVYFCTNGGLKVYQGDPDRFIAGEIEHPTDGE